MRRLKRGEQIGGGLSKEVFNSPDDENRVVGEFSHRLPPEQIKSAYYLSKIANILFPKNIPPVTEAFNDLRGNSYLQIRHGKPDAMHIKANKVYAGIEGSDEDRKAAFQLWRGIDDDPKIAEFAQKAEEKGIKLDTGPQNFGWDREGNLLYLETNPAWEGLPGGDKLYWFDETKLKNAIEQLSEPERTKALKYFERLMSLIPKK